MTPSASPFLQSRATASAWESRPRATFPWADRLVVIAWAYLPEAGSPGSATPGTGRVARFATENHYRGLQAVLDSVAAELRADGWRAEPIHDDSRLVDRAAAVRAGVGWWGKNTMVLAPGTGPWLLLGSVATDASLDPSEPMVRGCGTCEACLPACPTGALVAPGVLDARRCLAHVLQAKGSIPLELRSAVGDRFYGCDDCLDACPPGRGLLEEATDPVGRVDFFAVLDATDEELLDTYGHFFIPQRRARFLRRNALVALGNSGGSAAVDVLGAYLLHDDWLLRAHAAWALGAIGTDAAAGLLDAAAENERHPEVQAEIAAAQHGR